MHIGQFCDVYPPETDGVGMVVKSYTEELTKLNHRCYYISPKIPNYSDTHDFPTFHYMSIRLANGIYRAGVPIIDIPYRKSIKKTSFDIIHAHSPFSAGREALRIAKKQNVPLVSTFHTKYYDDFYSKTHSKLLAKTGIRYIVDFYNDCDEIWAVNNSTSDVLREYGYKKDIQIMPNGTNSWHPAPGGENAAKERFGLRNDRIFLFVGQQDWKKNIKHIIEALKIYSSSESDFKMVFAGKGSDEEEIKEFVNNLGLSSRCLFTGHISDRELLMSLYAQADLFIFPSLYDNAPMVVREAAAAGTPSLLLRNSCAAEGITHDYNGFLCDNTPKSIAECISSSLPKANQVGLNAQKTIPISWSSIMIDVESRYKNLILKKKCVPL
ncbi:MAG: glycosyltransferase [Eubacteriales bacterium]|nr:glycosyltransferase [Eubacteriales bacterium]MDD4422156.1 glycosyltransferase [Eubacteriales bacterium]